MSDFAATSVLDFKFSTILDAVPTTLAGTPVVSVYKNNSTTQTTVGVTLTVDFDGMTGSHNVRVDTSADGTFYASGSSFQVVVTAGTVGGKSLVGFVVDQFTLGRSADTSGTTSLLSRVTGTVLLASGYTTPPTAAANATAVRTELATELGRIDAAVTTRMAAFTLPTNFSALSISSGGALTLTASERTAIANEVEAQIIDETDSEKVLTAITDKIASTNPSLTGLTLSAIASAVRTNLATELARIDTTIGSRSTYAGGPVASVTAPVTLAATQVFNNTGTWTGNLLGTVSTVTTLTNLPAAPADWLGAGAVSTGAVAKIQNGLSTYAGGDTAGVTKLVSTLELISGSSYRFKAAALTNVAGGGGGGASLPQETIDALNGAAQILLATLYVPPEPPTPVVVVPYVPSIGGRML